MDNGKHNLMCVEPLYNAAVHLPLYALLTAPGPLICHTVYRYIIQVSRDSTNATVR